MWELKIIVRMRWCYSAKYPFDVTLAIYLITVPVPMAGSGPNPEHGENTIMETWKNSDKSNHIATAVDIASKLGLLVILVLWCFHILSPFIMILLWGIIIAVSIYPLFTKLAGVLGNRFKLSAVLLTLILILAILLPTAILTESLVGGVHLMVEKVNSGLNVPDPPDGVGQWPIIGRSVERAWRLAAENLELALLRFEPQLKSLSVWMLNAAVGSGLVVLQFLASIIVAGIILPNSERGGQKALRLFAQLAGERGDKFANITVITLRNVARGILGVAFIQALLTGIGCAIAGVPAAGLWAFLCIFFAIIQIGIFPVTIPIIIYMFYQADTITAVFLAVWLGVITISDNFLKPILLGKGAPAPMLVIFLGAIGGFITMGFIGLFIGAVVLSVGYMLFVTWMAGTDE
jgi:predicted PurR-regulated permease PerM